MDNEYIKLAFTTFNRSQILVYLYIPLYDEKNMNRTILYKARERINCGGILLKKPGGIEKSNFIRRLK